MKLLKKILLSTSMLSLSLLPLFSAGSDEQKTSYSGEAGRITVYLSGPETMLLKLENQFESGKGDVLDLVHMGCGPLRQRIWTEAESGGIRADVFWGSDPLIYLALDEKGALHEYRSPQAEAAKEIYQSENNFSLVSERYGVAIYNKDITGANKPSAFADLSDPFYRDQLVHADPAQSSTALALIAGLWDHNGTEGAYHESLIENGLFLCKKNSDVPSKIQEGEFTAGIAPHDAVLRLQKKAKADGYPCPLAIAWPKEGAVAIQRPVAISKNPARPEANQLLSEELVDFLLSKKAQTIMAQFGFVSTRNDVPLPQGVPEDLTIRRVDWETLSVEQNDISNDFKALFQ